MPACPERSAQRRKHTRLLACHPASITRRRSPCGVRRLAAAVCRPGLPGRDPRIALGTPTSRLAPLLLPDVRTVERQDGTCPEGTEGTLPQNDGAKRLPVRSFYRSKSSRRNRATNNSRQGKGGASALTQSTKRRREARYLCAASLAACNRARHSSRHAQTDILVHGFSHGARWKVRASALPQNTKCRRAAPSSAQPFSQHVLESRVSLSPGKPVSLSEGEKGSCF